ncbi:MAG TPA: universal stress protein [Candidatus Thermoplasmatota archaeon]|nr:universal stress protein [Candidatus Thermoplasmatota archaeon]
MAASRPILVAVDFSPCSRAALDAAAGLAEDMEVPVVLVHALTALPAGTDPAAPDPVTAVRLEVDEGEAIELSTEWAGRLRKRGLDVETVARRGKPADIILKEAKARNAALVVVGTHGRTGFRHLVLGSVAEAVVRRSDRPVLAVPDPQAKAR